MIREVLRGWLYQADQEGAVKFAGADAYPPRDGLMKSVWRCLKVICAAPEVRLHYRPIPRLHLEIHETSSTKPEIFDAAVAFYEISGPTMLVHCNMGRNRSSAVSAAILVGVFNAPADRALARTNPELPPALLESFQGWSSSWRERRREALDFWRPKLRRIFFRKGSY